MLKDFAFVRNLGAVEELAVMMNNGRCWLEPVEGGDYQKALENMEKNMEAQPVKCNEIKGFTKLYA